MACDLCEPRAAALHQAIRVERENRQLRQAVRDLQALTNDDPNVSYVLVLLSRIEGLERNVERLTRKKAA